MPEATTPVWALSLAYWVHMVATVTWIGGLAAMALLIVPAARSTLDAEKFAALLEAIQRRLGPVGWLSLVLLLGTGMFQLSGNENYRGLLAVENRWGAAILIKHLLFFGMTGVSAYLTWSILPDLRRAALRQARGQKVKDFESLQKQEARLLRINLVLGILILAMTAIARAS